MIFAERFGAKLIAFRQINFKPWGLENELEKTLTFLSQSNVSPWEIFIKSSENEICKVYGTSTKTPRSLEAWKIGIYIAGYDPQNQWISSSAIQFSKRVYVDDTYIWNLAVRRR